MLLEITAVSGLRIMTAYHDGAHIGVDNTNYITHCKLESCDCVSDAKLYATKLI